MQTINEIVKRAERLEIVTPSKPGRKSGAINTRMDCDMDITACHCNGNTLNLAALLVADDFNFSHDVSGIASNLNRQTGKLENCFVPRFTVREGRAVQS